jgi:hypothetical protein
VIKNRNAKALGNSLQVIDEHRPAEEPSTRGLGREQSLPRIGRLCCVSVLDREEFQVSGWLQRHDVAAGTSKRQIRAALRSEAMQAAQCLRRLHGVRHQHHHVIDNHGWDCGQRSSAAVERLEGRAVFGKLAGDIPAHWPRRVRTPGNGGCDGR